MIETGRDPDSLLRLKSFLDHWVTIVCVPGFIPDDPICIPHRFNQKQDVEIAAFFAAILAWGKRKTIIDKCSLLMDLMGNAPHDFILNHTSGDLKKMESFVHRTFNATDLLFFIKSLQEHYKIYPSLESAFVGNNPPINSSMEEMLKNFYHYFFRLPYAPQRTKKHIATPEKGSACKRLNMFLRWMVRPDEQGVDFGIWHQISPSILCQPLDVHVERTARNLGLLNRRQRDWKAVRILTENLRKLNVNDPIRYDFALFGIGLTGMDPKQLYLDFSK